MQRWCSVQPMLNALDIDANHCDELFAFNNRHFIAELPRFAGNEYQNIYWWGDEIDLTEDFKAKALGTAVTINGCKKDVSDWCRRGYSWTKKNWETYVNELTDRIMYQWRYVDDLRIVQYNLQMMMDWDSLINVEYSGSGHLVQYFINTATKAQHKVNKLKQIWCKCMIWMMRSSYLHMTRFHVQCLQCGVFMDIRTIQHLFLLFVLSKCKLNSNWPSSTNQARCQTYKFTRGVTDKAKLCNLFYAMPVLGPKGRSSFTWVWQHRCCYAKGTSCLVCVM